MKRFEKVLLASDMDGTLLNSNRLISKENQEALRWFTEQGGHFCLATGRAVEVTRMYFNDVPVNAPYICLNGALVYGADGTLLRHNSMPEDTLLLLDTARKMFPGIGVEVYLREKIFILQTNPLTEQHFWMLGIMPPHCALKDLPSCTEWSKINFTGTAREIAQLQELLEPFKDRFSTASSMPTFCEVTSITATKGAAVSQAAELCGIRAENVYTVGDSANDLSMLQKFYSFAPENCELGIQQVANEIVCDNDHSAIARVIDALAKRYPDEKTAV